MNEQHEQHPDCPLCIGRAACLFGFCKLLQENHELRERIEEHPTQLVHFVVDLHSLQANAGEIEWTVVCEDDDLLMVVDTRVKDPSAHMVPMARMVVTCAELLGEIDRVLGILAQRREKEVAVC